MKKVDYVYWLIDNTLLNAMKWFAEYSEKYNDYSCSITVGGSKFEDSILPNPSFYGYTYIKELIQAMFKKNKYTKNMLKYQNNLVKDLGINDELKWIILELKNERKE